MSLASGIGSMPGGEPLAAEADNSRAYIEAVKVVLGELTGEHGLPHVPEMPGRGAIADMVGRTLGVVAELGVDLQPAGWRLTASSGMDHRRARSLLAQDLDQVEEQAQGVTGAFKTQITGPWTLAAMVEKPRGDKILSDHGARRELGQALAEGLRTHVADLRRRLSGVERLVIQVDEPALSSVMEGQVPTASGYGRHRTVHPPEVSETLTELFDAIKEAGAEPWVHSCAAQTPWALLRGAGARGLIADFSQLDAPQTDQLAEHLEAGGVVGFGVLPSTEPSGSVSDSAFTEQVLRWLDMVGMDAGELGEQVVVTPACGLAGASDTWSRRALGLTRTTARNLS